ncbi:unnamed protein product (macronuclear) [Paramecium tetraurelia]|uniref:Cytochrome b5 heme-binding domain-containing protein n=1 Tax=Paramecium tetraurelia TaxID=5888 RepID=A0EDK3_PARTE|nr:uncharacterized protein GSPATT00025713001 [Paramecium tetraurelia]CAK93370.1 unnamed protein product [Paramecium tetraurelia]|eukprot:XP_001460767.1 hypothetical protein (macronuclear) [Paramecium tetraurelia strain d4-2]
MLKKYSSIAQMQQDGVKSDRFLFAYRNNVFDLTHFVDDHPGGRFSLQTFKGKDLENILFNASIHRHQPSVLSSLEQYKCGVIEIKNPQDTKPKPQVTATTKSNTPSKNDQICKTQMSDDKTNRSNITSKSKVSIQQQSNILSTDSNQVKKSNLKQNSKTKSINKTENIIAESTTTIKSDRNILNQQKLQETQQTQLSKSSLSLASNQKISLLSPQIIHEEDESQPSPLNNNVEKFECGFIPEDIVNLQVPILNYQLTGYLRLKHTLQN